MEPIQGTIGIVYIQKSLVEVLSQAIGLRVNLIFACAQREIFRYGAQAKEKPEV